MRRFHDDDFQFGFEIALGATYRQAADAGEVLVTAARIKDGDADSWVREWLTLADRVRAEAEAGAGITALAHFRRAATYYSTALYQIAGSSEHGRRDELWARQQACWERVVALSPVPGEPLTIPYEDTSLPGWFFRAPDAEPGEQRPLVVMNNGSDGASAAMWTQGGAAASERGWHWMTFEGPGQQSMLVRHGIAFRPDWEAVLTPVLDRLLERDDVDPARVAVIGVSQAGYWVPRALAFEHRFAAGVVDPGVVDVSSSWLAPLPGHLRKELEQGRREAFDRNMRIAQRLSSSARATLRFRGEPYGLDGDSVFDLYQEVGRYRLGDEVAQIRTPLLITDPEDEQFWPGQSQRLYDLLGGERELVRFTAAEGANRHCEPMGAAVREARIFDWLASRLA